MKKLISTILIISFMVSLVACGNKETPNPNNQPENPGQVTEIETKPAIDAPKPVDPSTSDKNDEPAPELPAVYTETNLSEILESNINAISHKYSISSKLSIWSVEEIDSFDAGYNTCVETFKVGYIDEWKRVYEYYTSVPFYPTEDNNPKEFKYWFQYIDEGLNLGEVSDFYKTLYATVHTDYGDSVKLQYELVEDDVKKSLENKLGKSIEYLAYRGTYGWDESHITVLSDNNNYYYLWFDNYANSNLDISFEMTGLDSITKYKTPEEAACCTRFGIEDAQTSISYGPYGFVVAKGNASTDGFFYGRYDYYEGKAPNLGPDYKACGTKTIYNVFTLDNQYVKTVAKKDARTFRGINIGDSKYKINEYYGPEIHSEPCGKIDETREYYWYCKNDFAIGEVLVIIVENDKVVELQSVYLEATDADHKPHSYSNEFPGEKESAKEIELTEEMKQFFSKAYGFFKCFYLGRFDYVNSDMKDSNGWNLSAVLDEDKNQFTIESLRENCEKYYSKATVESMVSLNNVIGHDLYHFIDNKLYIYDSGIGDDITVGDMKAVKLFELDEGSRVLEIELERFSEIDFSVVEPDTVYFKMVNENGRYVFDNMYCVDY